MPFQLIYTSAARLLDSPLSGYGVVARSEGIPAPLLPRLVELSVYKEPAEQGILGPQFTYCLEECLGQVYHVFTSVRFAGTDYSMRSCHLAHHLILRDDEARALSGSGSRPTPAGIILALELRRFWLHRWQGEPELLGTHTIPPLGECPGTENQPTWLIFSGSNANARAFQTPPFHQGCLALVPQRTQARDILRLLHESNALSPTLGWGIPFCTYSVEADNLSSQQRLFSTAQSPLHQRAQRSGFPLLDIRPGLVLPNPQPAPTPKPTPQPQAPQTSATPEPAATPRAGKLPAAQPYLYEESSDTDTFEKPIKRRSRKSSSPWKPLVILALLAALGAYAVSQLNNRPGASPTPQETEAVAPKPAKPARQKAEEPPAPTAPSPEPQQDADADTEPETPTPAPLPQEPTPTEEDDDTPNTEDDATADDDAEPQDTDETPADEEAADTPGLCIITTGQRLPENVLRLLPTTGEQILVQGEYILHLGRKEGQFVKRLPLQLEQGKTTIAVRESDQQEYTIAPALIKGKKPSPSFPAVTLQLEDGVVKQVFVTDSDTVAVQLPLVNEQGQEVKLLLLPKLDITLRVRGKAAPVGADSVNTTITEKHLLQEKDKLRLRLTEAKTTKQMTWRKSQPCRLELDELVFNLPHLSLPNVLKVDAKKNPVGYTLELGKASDGQQGFVCTVKQHFRPANAIGERFQNFANMPCCGALLTPPTSGKANPPNPRIHTIANLHQILHSLAFGKKVKKTDLAIAYTELFRQPEFAEQLRGILRRHPGFILNSDDVDKLNKRSPNAFTRELRRKLVSNNDDVREMYHTLLEAFSLFVKNEYKKQYDTFMADHSVVSFHLVAKVKLTPANKLEWSFELKK